MKNVVILGSGYAGSAIAAGLDKVPGLSVTVVDRREAQVHKIGALRAAVNSKWTNAVLVPRDKLLKNGKVVQGEAKEITETAVALQDGSSLPYDYLVVATGATSRSPGEPADEITTLEGMKAHFGDVQAAVQKSNDIVILGGGVVGLELAGELRAAKPNAKITIVHAASTFVNRAEPALLSSFQTKVSKQLNKLKISYLLGDKLVVDPAAFEGKAFSTSLGSVQTASGKELKADLVFNCSGTRVNSSGLPKEWLNEAGQVRVGPTLQVKGKANVFAAGDVTDIKESKMAYTASTSHAPAVVKNIVALSKGKAAKATHTPGAKPFMIIPLGPTKGVMVTPMGTLGPFFARSIKGKSLFLSMPWKANNRPTPSIKN